MYGLEKIYLLKGETVYINGDGETSRDFSFVANAVQANILAACSADPQVIPVSHGIPDSIRDPFSPAPLNQVYNVAVGDRTTLNQLFAALRDALQSDGVSPDAQPSYRDFRAGDVRHSKADIGKAQTLLGYALTHAIQSGIDQPMPCYVANRNL